MLETTDTLQGAYLPETTQALRRANMLSIVAALLLASFYLATSLYISSHRLLWIDEVLTAFYTRLPAWTDIWKASTKGGDGLPPTYFMVVRMFDNWFGHDDFSLRLPSALAMTAGLLLTFDCARRLTDGLHGLIALAVLSCSFLPYYGHEARSYALYFMLAALALWVWTCTKSDKRWSAVLFGAVLFLGIAMHYYAILCLVPYAVWEISNWKPWRLPSLKMIAGVLGVTCAAALLWAPIQAGRQVFAPDNWQRPNFDTLRTAFADLFPDGLFLLALVVVWIAWTAVKDRVTPLPPMQPSERVGWFFFLIPLAGYLLGQFAHAFQLRYVIGTLPGVAIAFSCWLWRHFHGGALRVSVGVFLILATAGLAKQVLAARDPGRGYYSPIRQVIGMETPLRGDGKQFFVFCNQSRYMEALQYSKHPQDYALLMLADPRQMRELTTLAQYYPMQLWTLEDLKKHAQQTALLVPLQSNLDTLQRAGFETTTRFGQPLTVVYLK